MSGVIVGIIMITLFLLEDYMQIQKYEGNNGAKITQISLSDEEVESRLSKERKDLTQEELKLLLSIDGQQRG